MTPQDDTVVRIRAINSKAAKLYALILLSTAATIAGFAWAGR